MESKKIYLKTLTPVHIGSGEKLGSFEYYIHKNTFYKLNIDSCFKFLLSKKHDVLDFLNRWAEEKSGELSDNNNNRSKESFKMSIFEFIKSRDYLNDNNLANELLKEIEKGNHIYYSMKCDGVTGSQDVSTLLKSANSEIYLPGSSIKGIIRTALLKDALERKLDDVSFKKRFFEKLKQELADNTRSEKFGSFIEQDVFYCGTSQRDKIIFHDEKFDMMKFIHISDSRCLETQNYAIITKAQLLTFDKSSVQSQAPYIEAIEEGIEFESRITIDIDYIKMVHNTKSDKDWLDYETKFEQLFKLNLKDFQKLNYEGLANEILIRIEDALLKYSDTIINNEYDWLDLSESKHALKAKLKYDNFIKQLGEDKINIKLGQGLSFINNTIIDIIKGKNKDAALDIINNHKFGIVKKGKVKNIDEFPKSRKLSGNENNINGLGWVELRFEKASNG